MITDLEKTAFLLGVEYQQSLYLIRTEIDSLSSLHTGLITGRVSKIAARDSLYNSSISGSYNSCKSLIAEFGINDAMRLEDMKKLFELRYKQVKELLEKKR